MKLVFKVIILITLASACTQSPEEQKSPAETAEEKRLADSIAREEEKKEAERKRPRTASDITLTKELAYDKHTLEDVYPYRDTTRQFQWDKIKEMIAYVETFQQIPHRYGVLQNRRNKNGEAPLVGEWKRNAYKRVADRNGTERWQSVPLYPVGNHDTPEIYGRDGSLVSLLSSDTLKMVKVEGISFEGEWEIPSRYILPIGDTVVFDRIAFVDLTNQNICTVERSDYCDWKVLSMNPATSGVHKPPFSMETPTGIFVVQEKKKKMFFVKDGTSEIRGFAPFASRFTNGAYIHGVPVNNPKGSIIEYSQTLGTTPRSHMCVRNASSHAEFVYNWTKTLGSLVIVIE